MAHHFTHTCAYFTAARYMRTAERIADQVFMPTGMKPAYSYIMMTLEDRHPLSIMDIANELGYERSTVSRMVRVLEKRHLVKLFSQGRATEIDLVSDSAAFLKLANECLNRWGDLTDRTLGTDKPAMVDLLVKNNEKLVGELK